MKRANPRSGATLIESVAALIVLAIAIPPLISIFTEVAGFSVDSTFQSVSIGYADSLMEEIVSKAFEDPDLAAGSFGSEEGSRSSYDDVDDYDGLSNSPPTLVDGTLLDDYGGITRSVTVDNVTAADPDPTSPATDGSTDFKRILVSVVWTGGKGGEVRLVTLMTRGNDPPLQNPLDEAASEATASRKDSRKFEINLVSVSTSDVVIVALELSADVSTEDAKKLKLDGNEFWKQDSGYALPTGLTAVNEGSVPERTISAGESPVVEFESLADPVGTITYTLTLYYSGGASSTLTFPIAW